MTPRRAAGLLSLLALTALSFYLRTLSLPDVFQDNFVNFTDTDAWFHVRAIDHLAHNFPHAMGIDPYQVYANTQLPPAGPFFDWPPALLAFLLHASELQLYEIAAWYPAILGALLVPAIFLLGRLVFGTAAGFLAAAVIATLPGHFLAVSSLGNTDHHVMESLLAALLLWLILRAIELPSGWTRPLLAALAMTAYLLTFVGGAFLVAVIAAWALYQLLRTKWPDAAPFPLRPLYIVFGLPALLVLPFYRILWMPYSIAALLGAIVVWAVVSWWVRFSSSRTVFLAGLTAPAAIAVAFVLHSASGLHFILMRLMPSLFGRSGAVAELQPLLFHHGSFSLAAAWHQFPGSYLLSIVALVLLAELCLRRPQPRRDLIFFFGLATFVLAAGQMRMTYYFALAAALFSGFLAAKAFENTRPVKIIAAALLAAVLFWPNIAHAIEDSELHGGIPPDWRESLEWLRHSTPEPFPQADFYDARYTAPVRPDYSVLAWWDYGYWIQVIARRVPVSNPTQANAPLAASFFLSQSEAEARPFLDSVHARYVIVNQELPGYFTKFFEWDHSRQFDDYVIEAQQREADGSVQTHLLYRPAYYRSMVIRLFMFGGEAVAEPTGAALAFLRPGGELAELRKFPTEQEARAAEPSCRNQGCTLVSDNPAASCIRLEALKNFRQIHASPTKVLRTGSAVQIFEVF